MAKKGRNTAIVIGAIVLVGIIVAVSGLTRQAPPATTVPTGQPLLTPTPAPATVVGTGCATFYCGDTKARVNNYDALDPSTKRTEGTNVQTDWWLSGDNGVTFTNIATGTDAVFKVAQENQGFVWATHKAKSGQNFYLDVQTLQLVNARFREYRYVDISGDGTRDHLIKYSIQDLTALAGGQVQQPFDLNLPWWTQGTPSFITPTPADITGIGTTAGTRKFVDWHVQLDADTKATAMFEVEMKINSTATSKWDRGQSYIDLSQISGGKLGQLNLISFLESQDGTNTFYKYTISTTGFDTDAYFTVIKNGFNNKASPASMVWNLATSDKLVTTLTLRFHTAALGTTTISDAVQNNA